MGILDFNPIPSEGGIMPPPLGHRAGNLKIGAARAFVTYFNLVLQVF